MRYAVSVLVSGFKIKDLRCWGTLSLFSLKTYMYNEENNPNKALCQTALDGKQPCGSGHCTVKETDKFVTEKSLLLNEISKPIKVHISTEAPTFPRPPLSLCRFDHVRSVVSNSCDLFLMLMMQSTHNIATQPKKETPLAAHLLNKRDLCSAWATVHMHWSRANSALFAMHRIN